MQGQLPRTVGGVTAQLLVQLFDGHEAFARMLGQDDLHIVEIAGHDAFAIEGLKTASAQGRRQDEERKPRSQGLQPTALSG